jgi:N-carbamoylputrescine amidase
MAGLPPIHLAVCEVAAELLPGSPEWELLASEVRAARPDVFLLNEMPFGRWVASAPAPDREALVESQRLHEEGMARLGELGCHTVLGSRPAFEDGRCVNEAFVWQPDSPTVVVHTKQFFPNEEGYYEERWFDRGVRSFRVADTRGLRIGFLICTDVMFNEWARHYGRIGADVIAVPRTTPVPSLSRWETAVRMAAIVSGCYVASSNRAGVDTAGQVFGGRGWIVDPFGELVAETTTDAPVVAAVVDPEYVVRAKREYPCYVAERPHEPPGRRHDG